MSMHPVITMGLSTEHQKTFDAIATGNMKGIDNRLVNDLLNKYLVERDELGGIRISIAAYMEWNNYQDSLSDD